jgi:hypothetical protein
MQGAKRVSSLVRTVVCVRDRLLGTACLENGFVDNVARVHGCSVSGQRFPLWPHSLPFHGAVFHSWRCCVARIWNWTPAARLIRLEVDWRGNNYWRHCAYLYS